MSEPVLLLPSDALDGESARGGLLLQLLHELRHHAVDPVPLLAMRRRSHALRAVRRTVRGDVLRVLAAAQGAQRRTLLVVLGRRGRQVVRRQLPESQVESRAAIPS